MHMPRPDHTFMAATVADQRPMAIGYARVSTGRQPGTTISFSPWTNSTRWITGAWVLPSTCSATVMERGAWACTARLRP